jgi:glycosyltransferase involved in cell wall biosynthesis
MRGRRFRRALRQDRNQVRPTRPIRLTRSPDPEGRADAREAFIEYLIVVPVRFHRAAAGLVATESAFAEHLRMLRRMLAPRFDRIRVAAPVMSAAQYERTKGALGHIREAEEGIELVELFPADCGRLSFLFRWFPRALARLRSAVKRCDLLHGGTSHDLWRPFEFPALALAVASGKRTICVADIDLRREAEMSRATGRWSRKSYLVSRWIYDPLRNAELSFAAKRCSLVLFKGASLVRDFGRGRPEVKDFYDTAFSEEHVIPAAELAAKLARFEDAERPLELVYFGRLTGYKGVDRCLQALALAVERGFTRFRFQVIGDGEQRAELEQMTRELGLADRVQFRGAVPFGPALFERLWHCDLSLAAPLSPDTPRSAFDALASGVPVLAFDTSYYADLAKSGAVVTVPWPSVDALAERIEAFGRDKRALAPMAQKGVAFARENTQEIWLERRVRWTLALFEESA